MKRVWRGGIFLFVIAVGVPLLFSGISSAAESGSAGPAKIVQSGAILTVVESKRLIAKAVAQMPIVKNETTRWPFTKLHHPLLKAGGPEMAALTGKPRGHIHGPYLCISCGQNHCADRS